METHRPARPGTLVTAIAVLTAVAVTLGGAPADDRARVGDARPVAVVERTPVVAGDEIRRSVGPALVTIVAQLRSQNATGVGTGIVLSPDGEVLTNYHVIAGGSAIRVTDVGNGETYAASVVGADRQHDVAVLRLRGASGLRVARLGSSATVRPGIQVAAIGDADGPGEQLSVVTGSITGLGRAVQTRRDELTGRSERLTGLIEVAADVREGFSGGPVVDGAGRVLGVTVAATVEAGGDDPGGSGFAIPINTALAAARRTSTHGGSVHGGSVHGGSADPRPRQGALAGQR